MTEAAPNELESCRPGRRPSHPHGEGKSRTKVVPRDGYGRPGRPCAWASCPTLRPRRVARRTVISVESNHGIGFGGSAWTMNRTARRVGRASRTRRRPGPSRRSEQARAAWAVLRLKPVCSPSGIWAYGDLPSHEKPRCSRVKRESLRTPRVGYILDPRFRTRQQLARWPGFPKDREADRRQGRRASVFGAFDTLRPSSFTNTLVGTHRP